MTCILVGHLFVYFGTLEILNKYVGFPFPTK